MNFTKFFFGVVVLSIFSGCEKLIIKPDPENTPEACFESLWSRVNEKYAFLTYKNINWDSIKVVYRPKFKKGMGDIRLFKTMDSLLYLLEDGHVNLLAPFNVSRNWEWYLGYPQNFNYSVVQRNYLGDDYYLTGPFSNQVLSHNGKSIGYIYYGSFSSNFSDYQLSYVLKRLENTNGLIIDVRDNGGGTVNNTNRLLNRFVGDRILVGKSFDKIGAGPNDFSAPYELYAELGKDSKGNLFIQYLNKPIIILTNRSCYSACNSFVGFMSTLPNVTLIGDQTGGGGGLPTSYQLPNGWAYRLSTTYTALPDGFNIENGIPVDVKQDMNPSNEAAGIDDIIDRALTLF